MTTRTSVMFHLRAKGGEVYIYRNEQHPDEDYIYTAMTVLVIMNYDSV